jgi:hypothetical protein
VRNSQPGDGLAHSGSHALYLASSLQVPGIVDDSDEAGGVRTVGYDAPASLKGIEDTQEAPMVETADAEALKPYSLPEAANTEQHMSHLVMQEPSPVSSINPDDPKPSPTPTDHPVTFPINQAPASIAVHAITYDVPYREAIDIPFRATPGPAHSESTKWIPLILSDTPDPLSTHTKANNSLVEGSTNVNGSTAEDWHATLGHVSFIDDGTLPRLSQWQETTPLPIIEHDHSVVAHGNVEAPWPCSTILLIPGDPKSPSTFISNSPAPMAPLHGH